MQCRLKNAVKVRVKDAGGTWLKEDLKEAPYHHCPKAGKQHRSHERKVDTFLGGMEAAIATDHHPHPTFAI